MPPGSPLPKEEVIANNSSSFTDKRQGNQRGLKAPMVQKVRQNTNQQNATSLHQTKGKYFFAKGRGREIQS